MTEILLLLVVLGVPGVIGYAVVDATLGNHLGWQGKLGIGLPIGLGVTGAGAFLSLCLFDKVSIFFDLGLLAFVFLWVLQKKRTPTERPEKYWPVILLAVCILSLFAACASFGRRLATYPLGDWDAWAFWNMRARFLFLELLLF